MDGKLTFRFYPDEDILYVGVRDPYSGQVVEELEEGVVARMNPGSRDVENLEILYVSRRLAAGGALELPVLAALRLEVP